jgi:hypothetical protein
MKSSCSRLISGSALILMPLLSYHFMHFIYIHICTCNCQSLVLPTLFLQNALKKL